MRLRRTAVAGIGVALAAVTLGGCGPVRWQSSLITDNAAGTNSGNGQSTAPSISADGTKIAFVSEARNFGLPDTNGFPDVFVHDVITGTTTLVSINRLGTNSGNAPSANPIISADGTKVVFISTATNLQALPVSGTPNIYVRDLTSATTTIVTVNAAGTTGRAVSTAFGIGERFAFSADGTKVAFVNDAPDLVDGYAGSSSFQLYVRDLSIATTSLVSVDATGDRYGNSASLYPQFSPDASVVAFSSFATDLVPGSSPSSGLDLFVRDLGTGTTSELTPAANAVGENPVFRPDGSAIVFETVASNLGPNDSNGRRDLYLTNLASGTTSLVSARSDGLDSGNAESLDASFSPDGTQLAFTSAASNLVGTDANEEADVFVRNISAGTTSLLSTNAGGTDSAIAASGRAVFASDTEILFESLAWNFGQTDTNNDWDLYLRNLTDGVTSLVSATADGTDSGDEASTTGAFGGGNVAYQSRSSDLGATDTNNTWDIYLAAPFKAPSATESPPQNGEG